MRMLDTISSRGEDVCVMTRNVRIIFWNLPRTKVFSMSNPGLFGILWWRSKDLPGLIDLHQHCLRLVGQIGLNEFSSMCHRKDTEADAYWARILEGHARALKGRT